MKHLSTNTNLISFLVFYVILALAVGCFPSANQEPTTLSIAETRPVFVQDRATTTITPSITFTSSPLPTATTKPTLTPSLTQTPTRRPTPTPSMTPLPTFSPADAQAMVITLLENNAGCLLPCWWGAIPGQTQWATIVPFLTALASPIPKVSSLNGTDVYAVQFYYPNNIPNPEFRYAASYYVNEEEVIEKIAVSFQGQENYYKLPSLLTIYGQPTSVLISTYSNTGGSLPFRTVMVYSLQNFAVYYGVDANKVGDNLVGCPQQAEGFFLIFFSAQHEIGLDDLPIAESPVLSIEAATNISLQNFYETYRSPTNTLCLETPANLWP